MSKIFLPTDYLDKACYHVNSGYIRVWNSINTNQQNIYYDIFVDQDYQVRQSQGNFSSNTICDHLNTYTDIVFYRLDFTNVLLNLFILFFFCFLLPLNVFVRFFRRLQ